MKSPISLQGKRICRYVRVSKDIQEGERQIFSTDSWARFNRLYIDQSFEDTEGSNSRDMSAKRVQFQKMLKACENGEFDAIVVDSLDRFGFKNNKELQYHLYMLDQWGVELWSVSQGCISDDDVATVFNTTAAAITSEKEQQEKALRNLEGRMANSRKGNYCGGPPPYALDVVCYGVDGNEKWRVVWMGPHQRLKYNPDGSTEEYNGKNNFPSRDATDILRLAPSIKKERIEAVQKMYQWFADELISFYQIAVRLNKENVQSIHSNGKIWNKGHVQHLLCNPVFIGFPTDNKKGQSRFFEYKDGKVRPVNPDDDNRVRDEKDYWRPEKPVFDPIVPVDLWQRVQDKLRQRAGKRPPPNPQRQEEFWLQPFMYCAGCGKKMRATYVGKGEQRHTYYSCSTYSVYGSINETGCQCNSIPRRIAEELIEAYLTEAAAKLEFDLKPANLKSDYQLKSLADLASKHGISITIRDDFKTLLRSVLSSFDLKNVRSIPDAYKQADERAEVERDVVGQIKKKQREFEDIYQHSKGLTDDAKHRANEEMNQISQEIKRLRSMLAPLDRADKIEREIAGMQDRLTHALLSLRSGTTRQKSQAIALVLEKVICKFEPTNKHRKRKAIITGVEFVPCGIEDGIFHLA